MFDSQQSRMSGGEEVGRRCLLCDQESHPYLGEVGQVQAHHLCIKFAKGIKNKKCVVGKTRLQVKVFSRLLKY